MIFLFFAIGFFVMFLYFRQREQRPDYIILAFVASLVFLQFIIFINQGLYDKIGFYDTTNCTYTFINESYSYPNFSSCVSYSSLNTNRTEGVFSTSDFYAFRAFDFNVIRLSGIMLFGIIIIGVGYIAYKGLKIENLIK